MENDKQQKAIIACVYVCVCVFVVRECKCVYLKRRKFFFHFISLNRSPYNAINIKFSLRIKRRKKSFYMFFSLIFFAYNVKYKKNCISQKRRVKKKWTILWQVQKISFLFSSLSHYNVHRKNGWGKKRFSYAETNLTIVVKTTKRNIAISFTTKQQSMNA